MVGGLLSGHFYAELLSCLSGCQSPVTTTKSGSQRRRGRHLRHEARQPAVEMFPASWMPTGAPLPELTAPKKSVPTPG